MPINNYLFWNSLIDIKILHCHIEANKANYHSHVVIQSSHHGLVLWSHEPSDLFWQLQGPGCGLQQCPHPWQRSTSWVSGIGQMVQAVNLTGYRLGTSILVKRKNDWSGIGDKVFNSLWSINASVLVSKINHVQSIATSRINCFCNELNPHEQAYFNPQSKLE